MKHIEGLDRVIQYATLLKEVDLDSMSQFERSEAVQVANQLNLLAHEIESDIVHTFTVDERLIIDQAQSAWSQYAKLRGHNPDAKIMFQEWIQRYDCDGIKLGKTLQESLDFLNSQIVPTQAD